MTTIDQAFIRAYLQDTAPGGPNPAAAADGRPVPSGQRQAASSAAQPAAEPALPADGQPGEAQFRPMLQVDGFAWSDRATSLRLAAGIQVDRLADGLTEEMAAARKVVAVAGCHRHQGCTAVLLCVAKRLADRGLKLALVDGDFAHPALAARLGVLPDAGIEAVLAGRQKLEDVAIESIADQVVVVPAASPCAAPAESREGQAILALATASLRKQYDLVLVDLGEIQRHTHAEAPAVRAVPHWVESLVLVEDVRTSSQEEIAAVSERVRHEGVAVVGVVENFV